MPQISYFLGIIIRMFYNDHNPPHFHAIYGDYEALIDIQKKEIIRGNLPARVLGIVVEWAMLHEVELLENWELSVQHQTLLPIEPLVK